MTSLRVRCTSAVSLPAVATPLPLSPFDAIFVSLRPLLHVYLFPSSPALTTPIAALAESLKSSLARTLPSFHPFAGELTYLPSSHTIAVVFPEKPSVPFIEAETDLDIEGLLEAELDSEALQLLVPDIQREALPAPVMAVQVTQVKGGVALGVALHHAVADGSGLFHFMQAWTAASCGSRRTSPLPLHDRNFVRLDGGEEFYRAVLRVYGPNLPSLAVPKPASAPDQQQHSCLVVRQTFVFTAAALSHLKRQHVAPANGDEQMMPSTFAAIAAHCWVSYSRARRFRSDDERPIYVGFFADCRSAMSLPAADTAAYVGNCVTFNKIGLKVSELSAPDGPARALSAIMEAVKKAKENPLENKEECVADNPWDRIFLLSGSPRFPAYELDLGFGRPTRVERACLGGKSEAYLTAGKEPGSVQAMVAMAADNMPAFRQAFVVDGVRGCP